MLRFWIVRAAIYIGVFSFGYAAAHFNVSRIAVHQNMHQTENPPSHISLVSNCPARDTATAAGSITKPAAPPEIVANEKLALKSDENMESVLHQQITISDFDNPDEQIRLALAEEPGAFTQTNEKILENVDPLESFLGLTEDKQLGYIDQLVKSQEDAAVVALNDLILNDNPPIQHAAIDGLISLLEMRTGHFALIAENLEQNSAFLNERQLQKLKELTERP